MKKDSFYRKFVLRFIDNGLEYIAGLMLFGVIGASFPVIEEHGAIGFLYIFDGIIFILLISCHFYCLLDIRNSLKSLENGKNANVTIDAYNEQNIQITKEVRTVEAPPKKTAKISIPVRICPNCGTDLGEEHGGFCPICGTNFME